MKALHAMVVGLVLAATAAPAVAGEPEQETRSEYERDARLVPAMRDGALVGLKVYAIRPGGRFEQAKFQNGDTILRVDGHPVVSDAGKATLVDNVIQGKADATVVVSRKGAEVTLTTTKAATNG